MSDTLYLQLDQNIEVTNPHVYLQDIAALSMSDPKILNRLRVMPVIVLDAKKPGRYVMSVGDLISGLSVITLVALCEALSRRLFSWLPARFTP